MVPGLLNISFSPKCVFSLTFLFSSQDDWAQTTTQTTEEAITEEDLVLIKERETNIRQLEVKLSHTLPPSLYLSVF